MPGLSTVYSVSIAAVQLICTLRKPVVRIYLTAPLFGHAIPMLVS